MVTRALITHFLHQLKGFRHIAMPQNMPTLTLQNLIQLGAHRGNSRRIRMLTLSTTLRLAGTLLTLRVELFRIIFSARLAHGRFLSSRPGYVYAGLHAQKTSSH